MEIDWAKGDVILVDGMEVAHASRAWWRERAEVQIGPELWHYRSEHRGTLVAELDGVVRFTARRSGVFSSTWSVDVGDQLQMRQASWFRTRLAITRAGAPVGEASSSGIFTTRPRMTVDLHVDTRAACFLLWVAHIEFNREQASNGASAGGAT